MNAWRIALTALAVLNLAVIVVAWAAGCGPLAALNVVGEFALVSAIADHPHIFWKAHS